MIIIVKKESKKEEISNLINMLKNHNTEPIYIENENALLVLTPQNNLSLSSNIISLIPCVQKVVLPINYSKVN